jgi:uncharacterized protein YgiM (DUF1202 family)
MTSPHWVVGLAGIMAFAQPALAKAPPSKHWKAVEMTHLRSAPSGRSPVVDIIPRDGSVTALAPCTKGWCSIDYNGRRGWVHKPSLAEPPLIRQEPAPAIPAKPAMRASLRLTPPEPPLAAPAFAPEETNLMSYRVVGLNATANLPIREGPLVGARIAGSLSASASGIVDLKTSVREWSLVEYKGVKGYVQSRFLAREAPEPRQRYGVQGEDSLKVFSFGGADAEVVGEIPYYASGIACIGDCDGRWRHIRYLGLVGFVDSRALRQEAEPEG